MLRAAYQSQSSTTRSEVTPAVLAAEATSLLQSFFAPAAKIHELL